AIDARDRRSVRGIQPRHSGTTLAITLRGLRRLTPSAGPQASLRQPAAHVTPFRESCRCASVRACSPCWSRRCWPRDVAVAGRLAVITIVVTVMPRKAIDDATPDCTAAAVHCLERRRCQGTGARPVTWTR